MGPDAPSRGTTGGTATYNRKAKRAEKRSESGSGDENAEPGTSTATTTTTPVSMLSPNKASTKQRRSADEEEDEELQIRVRFNALMDGRIARTRASSIDGNQRKREEAEGSNNGAAVGAAMSDLFPSA